MIPIDHKKTDNRPYWAINNVGIRNEKIGCDELISQKIRRSQMSAVRCCSSAAGLGIAEVPVCLFLLLCFRVACPVPAPIPMIAAIVPNAAESRGKYCRTDAR